MNGLSSVGPSLLLDPSRRTHVQSVALCYRLLKLIFECGRSASEDETLELGCEEVRPVKVKLRHLVSDKRWTKVVKYYHVTSRLLRVFSSVWPGHNIRVSSSVMMSIPAPP